MRKQRKQNLSRHIQPITDVNAWHHRGCMALSFAADDRTGAKLDLPVALKIHSQYLQPPSLRPCGRLK
jgi:hypothetical protein